MLAKKVDTLLKTTDMSSSIVITDNNINMNNNNNMNEQLNIANSTFKETASQKGSLRGGADGTSSAGGIVISSRKMQGTTAMMRSGSNLVLIRLDLAETWIRLYADFHRILNPSMVFDENKNGPTFYLKQLMIRIQMDALRAIEVFISLAVCLRVCVMCVRHSGVLKLGLVFFFH